MIYDRLESGEKVPIMESILNLFPNLNDIVLDLWTVEKNLSEYLKSRVGGFDFLINISRVK